MSEGGIPQNALPLTQPVPNTSSNVLEPILETRQAPQLELESQDLGSFLNGSFEKGRLALLFIALIDRVHKAR